MKHYLISPNGNFYKANLHMHTTVSDGRMTPEETKRAYVEKGYSIVAFTDHEIIVKHNELSDDTFLALTSCELSVTETTPDGAFPYKKTYHLNFLSKDPERDVFSAFSASHVMSRSREYVTEEMRQYQYPYEYSVECINDIIARCNEEGFLVTYNHPVWSGQNYLDYADLKGLWGIEVYNTGCAINGYPDTVQPLTDLLRKGERIVPLATDDAHSLCDCFGGWVMVCADALEYGAVMEALEKGEMYSSTGPEIKELSIEDGVLHVVTSEAVKIYFNTECRTQGCVRAEAGKTLCEANFDLNPYLANVRSPEAAFVRVTVQDANGNCAWSRAYFSNELK